MWSSLAVWKQDASGRTGLQESCRATTPIDGGVAKVVFEEWAHIPEFLAHDEDFVKASTQKLSDALLCNPVQLKVEFTAFMEIEKLVQATHTLEGEGTLVFIAFEKLEELSAFIHVQNFPSLA